jgi:hypothetical protein
VAPRAPGSALAPEGRARVVERARVRFYAPELGGATRPRFILEHVLGFEARLEHMTREGGAPDAPVEERHVRAAVDLHVAQELLAALPLERKVTAGEVARVVAFLRGGLEARVGAEALLRAAQVEGLAPEEVTAVLERQARAALAADRVLTPVLAPSADQLRDVFRTASHPYKGRPFEEASEGFARWFVEERLRVLEGAFLQGARGRVRVHLISS